MSDRTWTLEALSDLVDRWQPRLGLGHWSIELREADPLDNEDAILEVHRHRDAHRAVIYAAPWLLDGDRPSHHIETIDDAYVERAVVHELCHLLFRDLRYLVQDVLADELAGAAKATLDTALDRHEEATVDLLARGLVDGAAATFR